MLHRFRFIFFLAIALHFAWGTLLFISPTPGAATPVHQTVVALGRYGAASVFLVVASLALAAIIFEKVTAWWLLPQAAVLLAAMSGGLYAVAVAHYADGVPRPWPFILADQLPTILLAIFHTIAVVLVYAFATDAEG